MQIKMQGLAVKRDRKIYLLLFKLYRLATAFGYRSVNKNIADTIVIIHRGTDIYLRFFTSINVSVLLRRFDMDHRRIVPDHLYLVEIRKLPIDSNLVKSGLSDDFLCLVARIARIF